VWWGRSLFFSRLLRKCRVLPCGSLEDIQACDAVPVISLQLAKKEKKSVFTG